MQTSASRMRIIGPHCQEVSIEVLFRELWTYRSRLFATPRSRSFAHGTRTDRCPVTRERTSGGERPCPVSSCNQSFASPLARQLGNRISVGVGHEHFVAADGYGIRGVEPELGS